MSQQYNKVIKRRRRNAYLKRKNTAAKAKKKHAPGRPSGFGTTGGAGWLPPPTAEPGFAQSELARNRLVATARAQQQGVASRVAGTERLVSMPVAAVDSAAEALLLEHVDAIWAGGWQPTELARQGRIGCATAAAARLVGWAIATDHAGRRSTTLHHRWVAQIDALGLPRVTGRSGWVARWTLAEGLDRADAVALVVDVLAKVMYLPRLDPILPRPGSGGAVPPVSWYTDAGGAMAAETDPVLERIRNLLAKAESTTFEAEAMVFTAKAQELMTRHAIDAARLQGQTNGTRAQPITIRVPIDAPYCDAKSLLLQVVAGAGRCRSVFHLRLSLSTVVGFPADVAAVEVLFTSLLLQAQTAMADAAKRAPAGSRPRSQSFRSAFLTAYTRRIGDRLDEINQTVFAAAQAEHGSAFLPVLRSRADQVDEFMAERFGDLIEAPVRRGFDAAGWASGRRAADNAQLTYGEVLASSGS